MAKFLRVISRKHPVDTQNSHGKGDGAQLEKCLTTLDLISLGVGSCCGAGMYLTAGIIASKKAGPGGVLSFFAAGLVSVLTGFHYAELAGICPNTSGSAYIYAYITVGELAAFVIGWGLIAEYVIGTAAAAVALSETFHSLTNKVISGTINSGLDQAGLPHVDIVAALVCFLLMWLLASGVQMSARVNNILNGLNFVSFAVFVGAAAVLGSVKNWTDHGGFLPFGFEGVFSAIPTAYYAFVGFDGLATTGAECKNPVKSIPISIIISIVINIAIFSSVILGLTLNIPYSMLPADTATVDLFAMKGYPALKYVLSVGAVSGLFAATFGSLFPLPRVLQAMARDGLLFRYFAKVCPKRHTPLRATLLSGLVATFLAAFVELTLLIELVLIGTLLAYVIVTFITLIIRFVDIGHVTSNSTNEQQESSAVTVSCGLKRKSSDSTLNKEANSVISKCLSRQSSRAESYISGNGAILNLGYEEENNAYPRKSSLSLGRHLSENSSEYSEHTSSFPGGYVEAKYLFNQTETNMETAVASTTSEQNQSLKKWRCTYFENLHLLTRRHVVLFLLVFYVFVTIPCAILANFFEQLIEKNVLVISCLAASTILVGCMAAFLAFIPHIKRSSEGFRTPLVPLLPVITAGVNIYLMTSLRWVTWLLFLAWLILGLSIYLTYGTRFSVLNSTKKDNLSDTEGVSLELLDIANPDRKENAPLLPQE